MLAMLAFGPWFFSVWTGEKNFDSRTLAILAIGAFFVGQWSIHQTVSLSVNRAKGTAVAFILSSVIGLLIANYWVAVFGTTGAALGLLVGELIMVVSTGLLAFKITQDSPKAFISSVIVPPLNLIKRS